ncbi:MAG: dolichyl-phosphate beta-glucosyltransferase [Acidobacteriota bacterium]
MRPEVSIIVPAFDEQARLGESLLKIAAYVASNRISAEIVVVDDGSRDSTEKVAIDALAAEPEIPTQVIRYKENRGKGYAVRAGLMAAHSDIALFSDADLSTPIEEMHKLTDPIKAGEFDVTFGSRALDRTLIGTHQPWRREQGGKVVNFIIKTMSGLPFADTQCGFKAFNMRKFGPLLDVMTIDRFGFDVEFLYVANYHDLRLKEIPVRWDNVEGSKVSVVRDTRRMFFELNQIRRNVKRGNYDLPSDIETAESSATSV